MLNFMYFHRRRFYAATAFCGVYGYTCYNAKYVNNEIWKIGMAGSLSHLTVEVLFHFVDTVNVVAKLSESHDSSFKIIRNIYSKEGIYGFSKGFSAMFYGSAACGFIYFSLYKFCKIHFKDYFD